MLKGLMKKVKASISKWTGSRRDKNNKKALANIGKTTGKKKNGS